jgi:hypothetical protein
MAKSGWWSKHGVTVIAIATALALVGVALWLWRPHPAVHAGTPASTRSLEGWEIRYNATLALARRGSAQTPLDELKDMLDEDQQLRNFETVTQDGRAVIDEQAARLTVLKALEGAIALQQKRPELDLTVLNPAIVKLTESPNLTLREKAQEARKQLGQK